MAAASPAPPPVTLAIDAGTGVARVTLCRPERRNALSDSVLDALASTFRRVHRDSAIRAVVLAAAGPVFSAGRDLRQPDPFAEAAPLPAARRRARLGAAAMNRVRQVPQLTIAAVQGPAVGGGAVLALACDFRVLAPDAFLSTPEVELGLPLGWDTLPGLVALVGPARAKWLAAGCRRISARQALDWGFCEEIADDPVERATRLATEMAGQPRVAQAMVKEAVNRLAQPQRASEAEADQLLLAASDPEGRAARERRIAALSGRSGAEAAPGGAPRR